MALKEWLKHPTSAVSLVTVVFGLILFFFHDYRITDFLIISIIGFLGSDVVSKLFVRGKRGILQIPIFGTKAQPRGYGFIAFFLSILTTALLINIMTDLMVVNLAVYFVDLILDMFVGLILAALVYLDMYAKFYVH